MSREIISRRKFIGLVLVSCLSMKPWDAIAKEKGRLSLYQILKIISYNHSFYLHLGRLYENERQSELMEFVRKFGLVNSFSSVEEFRVLLAKRIQNDFLDEDVFSVGGWVLSPTEVLLCGALMAQEKNKSFNS